MPVSNDIPNQLPTTSPSESPLAGAETESARLGATEFSAPARGIQAQIHSQLLQNRTSEAQSVP